MVDLMAEGFVVAVLPALIEHPPRQGVDVTDLAVPVVAPEQARFVVAAPVVADHRQRGTVQFVLLDLDQSAGIDRSAAGE